MLHLQRGIVNQAVKGLVKSGVLHAKVGFGGPNDVSEPEVDRIAEHVMRKVLVE